MSEKEWQERTSTDADLFSVSLFCFSKPHPILVPLTTGYESLHSCSSAYLLGHQNPTKLKCSMEFIIPIFC